MGVSLIGGTQQPWVFLLKMIILGCIGGTTIFGNIYMTHTKNAAYSSHHHGSVENGAPFLDEWLV